MTSDGPRIGYFDCETAPNIAHVWSLRDQSVSLNQLLESSRMIGFAWKWRGESRVQWYSEYHHSREEMVHKLHRLLGEADAVGHYNGDSFDTRVANAEFSDLDLTPPSPWKNIDLYKVVKKAFRYPSYKLAYVSQRLLGDTKLETGGHSLWRQCLDPDVDEATRRKAWNKMRTYCRKDTALLEPLHDRLLPWLGNQFNMGLYVDGELVCQKCGGQDLESRGTAYTATRAYPQFFCRTCGGWTRDSKSSWGVNTTGVTS